MYFADSNHSSALSPRMTNCVWTAEVRKDESHTEAAYARTKDCLLLPDLELDLHGLSPASPFYTLSSSIFLRHGGVADDFVHAAVGERDLARNKRFDLDGDISIGCYQFALPRLKVILR